MPPDTIDDDLYASLRAMLPATTPAISTPKPPRGGKFGPQAPSRRRYKQPVESRLRLRQIADTFRASPKRDQAGPCQDCRHADRCAQGLACVALQIFVNTGKFSAVAPAQAAESQNLRKLVRPAAR
jgi:hypothetical protein